MKIPIAVICIVLIFTTCKKNATDSSDIDMIMPLAVGNSWVYETESDYSENQTDTETVSGTYTKNNLTYYYFDITDNWVYRTDDDGLWSYDINNDEEVLFIKYPVDIGERFGERRFDDGDISL